MGTFEVGVVLPTMAYGPDRTQPRWTEILAVAERAEAVGFDTIWVADELVWFHEGSLPQGCWEGVAMAGAVAASTSTAKVGTWVLSALHRNPGITAKVVETLDEISGGRFIFGLGAGHEWPGQARAFGLPETKIFDRYAEALEIVVPLLRDGRATFEGTYHAARDLPQLPRGPRPGGIPLMLGGNGPRAQRHAVRHATIWSGYIEERASPEEVAPKIASLEAICTEEGRDPTSIERSIGVVVNATIPAGEREAILSGSPEQIAAGLRDFRDAGFTRAELMYRPGTLEGLEAVAPVLELIRTA